MRSALAGSLDRRVVPCVGYAQILNMQAMAKTFGQSCELAAMKDDGQISKDEVKQLKRIKAAVEAFCKELDKVKD